MLIQGKWFETDLYIIFINNINRFDLMLTVFIVLYLNVSAKEFKTL